MVKDIILLSPVGDNFFKFWTMIEWNIIDFIGIISYIHTPENIQMRLLWWRD